MQLDESHPMTDARLTRIEGKLDKLSDAVVSMARMEERIITVFNRMDSLDTNFKKFDDRIDEVEKEALTRGQKIAFAERLFWMILTGAVGLAFIYLR